MKHRKLKILFVFGLILMLALSACGTKKAEISWEKSEILEGSCILLRGADQDERYQKALEDWKSALFFDAYDGMKALRDEAAQQWGEGSLEAGALNHNLGVLCLELAKYEEGYEYLNSALVTFREQLGEDSEQVMATRAALCRYEFFTGDYDTALKEAAAILETGRNDRDLSACTIAQGTQAEIYSVQGRFGDSIRAYNEILNRLVDFGLEDVENADYDPCLGASPEQRHENAYLLSAIHINRLGTVYGRMHNLKRESETYHSLLTMFDQGTVSREHYDLFAEVCLDASQAQGQHGPIGTPISQENYQHFMELAEDAQTHLQPNHPTVVKRELLKAQNAFAQGGYSQEVEDHFQEAIRISEACYGLNHPTTAEVWESYTRVYANSHYKAGVFQPEFAEMAENCIEIRKNILNYYNPGTSSMYTLLAGIWHDEDPSLSQEYLDTATEINNHLGLTMMTQDVYRLAEFFAGSIQNQDARILVSVLAFDYLQHSAANALGFVPEQEALAELYVPLYQEKIEAIHQELQESFGDYQIYADCIGTHVYTSQELEQAKKALIEAVPGSEEVNLQAMRELQMNYRVMGEKGNGFYESALLPDNLLVLLIDGQWKLGTPDGFPKPDAEAVASLKP